MWWATKLMASGIAFFRRRAKKRRLIYFFLSFCVKLHQNATIPAIKSGKKSLPFGLDHIIDTIRLTLSCSFLLCFFFFFLDKLGITRSLGLFALSLLRIRSQIKYMCTLYIICLHAQHISYT